jgi:hypothetical protein
MTIILTDDEVRRLDLLVLADEMRTAGIGVPIGVATLGPPGELDQQQMGSLNASGELDELPPEAEAIVQAHLNAHPLAPRAVSRKAIADADTLDELKTAVLAAL